MSEEMKGTTRYLDATVMEYALLDHARLRTPYGTQDDVRAYAAGGEKAALHDLALALADMASRTGISWTTASDTAPTFRDGGTEAYVELRRDQPNGHYSHLDAEAYLCTADGPRCIARLNLTEPGDIPSTVSGADGLASRIADRLNHPQFPKAGAYGPTAGRMGDWYRGVEERFAAMSEENRRTRAIEPDEEAYHVGTGMYVTAEQFADVLPSPLLANRFVIMSFGYDADQASLHWNDMDYWSDEAAETAITDGDEDGCYWTGCMWDEDDYPDRLETPGMEEPHRAVPADGRWNRPAAHADGHDPTDGGMMVWINKDTGVVLSKDGHTLFVDLVAEDEERERLAERSGLADPHGDIPDKEYLEAAVIIHDNGHAHGECYATDRHTGMVRFGRFELTDMELNQLGRELPFLADREDPRKGQERLGRFFGGSPYVRHSERYVGGGRHEANPDIRAGIADYLDAALAEYRESGYSAYEGGMSMTGYQTRDLSDIKAFISYIASSPDCPATTTLRSWAEYEDLSDHAGFLTDLLDEARGRLDGFGLSGPECGAGVDADAMGVQGPAR